MLRGDRLDQPSYSFLQTLPGGAVGEVKLVFHEPLQRRLVQKTINLLGLEDSVAYQEPRLLDQVQHDHVVRIRDAQPDPDIDHALTIVMDYLPGGSVYEALKDGHRFGVRQALMLAGQVLDALDHIHMEHRFLHRDVKPGNVLLDESRMTAYLGDLGSAAPFVDDRTCEAHGGTLLYRPPEFASGVLDARSDVYSLGVTLLEMLTGPFPYADMDPLKMEKALSCGRRAFPDSLIQFPPCINPQVRRTVRSLISQKPSSRPDSAMGALRQLQDCRTIDWKPCDGHGGVVAEWEGQGLPDRNGKIRSYRVEAVPLGKSNSGRVRVKALYRDRGSRRWRRLGSHFDGVSDDRDVLARAFAVADKKAFQR